MSFGQWIRNLRLPLSVIAGPFIWMAQLFISYLLEPMVCQSGSPAVLLIVGLVAGLATLGMGLVGWRGWRQYTGGDNLTDLERDEGLGEFFGSAGFIVSLLFLLLIAATALYGTLLAPCPFITMPFP